jgi:hypothetical protein
VYTLVSEGVAVVDAVDAAEADSERETAGVAVALGEARPVAVALPL